MILLISMSVTIISGIIITIYQMATYNMIIEDKKHFLLNVFEQSKGEIGAALINDQMDTLANRLNQITEEMNVFQVEIFSKEGELIIQNDWAIPVQDLSIEDRSYVSNLIQRETFNNGHMLTLTSKIIISDKWLGYIKIYYSLDSIWDTIYLTLLITIVYFLISFSLVAWWLNIALKKTILLPIENLKQVIKKMKKGVIPKNYNKLDSSEIGEVTAAFYKLAKENYKTHHSLIRKNKEFQKLMDELKSRNVILKNQIKDRKKIENSLNHAIGNKNLMMKEVHHRVKDNMQIISSLLKLQALNEKSGNIDNIIFATDQRIQSMSLIHDQLYNTGDMANIDFEKYVQSLMNYLFQYYKADPAKVQQNIIIKGITININQAIPCGLIVNELVSNSIKNAFDVKREGQIFVIMEENETQFKLIIHDTDEAIVREEYTGKDPSFGLHLVKILGEDQLGGDISINKEDGTKVEIVFPKSSKMI